MANFERFMKKHKAIKANTFYAATKSIVDENGEPLKWEIKALTTKESEAIREKCTIDVAIPGKPGMYRQKMTKEYIPRLICAAVVSPDLQNAELQDSYCVKTPEDLLLELVDSPSEYSDLLQFVQNYSGIDDSFQDEITEAKN